MRISQAAISPLKTTTLLIALGAVTGCRGARGPELGAGSPPIQLTTTAFHSGDRIPGSFTCDGANTSPALTWSDPPAATKSFALVSGRPGRGRLRTLGYLQPAGYRPFTPSPGANAGPAFRRLAPGPRMTSTPPATEALVLPATLITITGSLSTPSILCLPCQRAQQSGRG